MIKTAFIFLILTALPAMAIDIPEFPWVRAVSTPEAEFKKVMQASNQVLQELERGAPLALGRRPDFFICSRAGWVLAVRGGSRCFNSEMNRGCPARQIRCAPWMGAGKCVPDSNQALSTCLRASPEPARAAHLYFRDSLEAGGWQWYWTAIQSHCSRQSGETACGELKSALKSLSGKRRLASREMDQAKDVQAVVHRDSFMMDLLNVLFPPAMAANPACGVTDTPKGRVFNSGDGRRVQLEHGEHMDNSDLLHVVTAWTNAKGDKEKFKQDMLAFIAGRPSLLQTYRRQHESMKRLVSQGQAQWVGLEMLPTNFSPERMARWRSQAQTEEAMLRSAGLTPAQINDAFLMTWGPYLAGAVRGEPWAKATLTPIDSDKIKGEGTALSREIDSTYNGSIVPLVENGSLGRESAAKFFDAVEAKWFSTETSLTPDEREAMLQHLTTEEAKKHGRAILTNLDRMLSGTLRRDPIIARNIIRQNGNGVILLGEAHAPTLRRWLQMSCDGSIEPRRNGNGRDTTTEE